MNPAAKWFLSQFTALVLLSLSTLAIEPSGEPFIHDDASGLQAGMEVMHEKFGEGKVVSVEGGGANKIASIFFGSFGIKKIMLKFAKLKILTKGI